MSVVPRTSHLPEHQAITYILSKNLGTAKLAQAGIPAAEIVGPWCDMAPAEYVKAYPAAWRSPDIKDWLVTHNLDSQDRELINHLEAEWARTSKKPSVERVRQISNALEKKRREEEDKAKLAPIQNWLDWSACQRRPRKTLPKGWYYITDAQEILDRSRRDGLCLADTIADLGQEDKDEDERQSSDVWFLVANTDPKRRTVVGLNRHGVVESEHHATGNDNKVDEEAFHFFSRPPEGKVKLIMEIPEEEALPEWRQHVPVR